MDDSSNLNSSEFDLVFELVIVILFMSIGLFSLSRMITNFNTRDKVYTRTDKIEVSARMHEAEDPFYFTGYQAYMFAWHMDTESSVPLSWVGGKTYQLPTPTDEPHDFLSNGGSFNYNTQKITLGILDENEQRRSHFLTWRNQKITGAGLGSDNSVALLLNTLQIGTDKVDASELFKGTATSSDHRQILYHLDMSSRYSNSTDNSLGYTRRLYEWTLAPVLK